MTETRECQDCHGVRPVEAFYKTSGGAGRSSRCRNCIETRAAQHRVEKIATRKRDRIRRATPGLILAGTKPPHVMISRDYGETWNELETWVNRLGVDPMAAIRAATYWPAVMMKVERDVGTVSEGKYADVIAVRGDVLRHIALLQRVDVVMKRGVRYK